jgi:hypothetical protein
MQWLNECRNSHDGERTAKKKGKWMPMRLINLGEAQDGSELKLQTTFSDRPLRYLTLSHR